MKSAPVPLYIIWNALGLN